MRGPALHPSAAFAALVLIVALAGCEHRAADYVLVHRFPHDTAAFTEGLLYRDGVLYESVGLYGASQVRREDLSTGRVLASTALAADRFGEGLALFHGTLYQLTWKSGVGYEYDAKTLARTDSFHFAGQGWGLTSNDTSLIMSNGTDTLRYLDPRTLAVTRALVVRDTNGFTLSALNELEYVHGALYANVYQSTWIVRIDPATGRVRRWIDLSALVPRADVGAQDNVLNGIAYDDSTGDLLVTGKRWPVLYEIRPRGP
jgi:glutaminyl-peptide cyclotransferase